MVITYPKDTQLTNACELSGRTRSYSQAVAQPCMYLPNRFRCQTSYAPRCRLSVAPLGVNFNHQANLTASAHSLAPFRTPREKTNDDKL